MDWLAYIPWYAWIAIIGIIIGGLVTIVGSFTSRNSELTKTIESNTAINEKLVERLEAIDARLGAVEKTLNDIP